MRRAIYPAAVLLLSASCVVTADHLAPSMDAVGTLDTSTLPAVRFSEIHYDNTGADAGEAIEVSGPAGGDLTGWAIVLYNGASSVRAPYDTVELSGAFPVTCDPRGVVVLAIPGLQNGSPDGMALVDAAGGVVEFLSYEGAFTAASGAAAGMTSSDIGVSEAGTEPLGQSLQRNGADVWSGPITSTFGVCNDNDTLPPPPPPPPLPPPPPPPPPPPGSVHIVELHYDNSGTDAGEAVEVEGLAGTDLTGWTIVLYNGNPSQRTVYNTRTLSGIVPATCGDRGVIAVDYPSNGIQNGGTTAPEPDGVALVDANNVVVEFLSYEGAFTAANGPAAGMTSTDIGVDQDPAPPSGESLQKDASGWYGPVTASFGACNVKPPPPANTITIFGRSAAGDPPLPVGFQDQLFATLLDGNGNAVPTATFEWSSDTPALAGIDQNGVITALAEGTAVLRATANEGTTRTISLPTRVAIASATAQYAGNAEFGEPADADASDDFIVRHPQYTASFNRTRGTPNWVSYDLDATHFGGEDRCECFTFDPALPADFTHYTTADYTGAGAFAGFGIDRGHLARSFDRTSGSLDNAFTYYFSNIVPQAADLNQGPWSAMEFYLGDFARDSGQEVYIIAGVAGENGTIKGEGKITIPAYTWKVALILPRDRGLADVHSYRDVKAVAVIMPNQPGIRLANWETYKTTIDAVETLSGYDLLALLPDPIEIAVESNTKPPEAVSDGPYQSLPHLVVSMSGAGSSDPDGDALTYAWTFGDGMAGAGRLVSHAYDHAGTFNVRLIVTDIRGLADTTFTSATILTPAQAISDAEALVDQNGPDAKWLTNKLELAIKLLGQATTNSAVNQLEGVLQRLDHSETGAPALAAAVRRIIQSLTF